MSPSENSRKAQESGDVISDNQNESKKMTPPKKVYTHRNSVLTDLMQVNHLQTVYNISVAVFNLCLLNAVLYYIAAPKMFQRDMSIMVWAAANVKLFVAMWVSFNIYAFLVFQGFKSWVRVRNKINAKLVDIVYLIAYVLAIMFMFVATTRMMLKSSFRPISNFAIMCEQVRIFMKIYSFVKESIPRVLLYKPPEDGDQEHHLYPTMKHFTYFLFAPALIYRDSYPRKKDVDWDFVLHNLFKFFACIFITHCVFTRFVVDVFGRTGLRPFTLPEAALVLCGAMVVGSMMMFLMFYGVLHSWLNVFAEVLGFGDREFYQDWWNSTSFSQYYRKWNTVVHDWLYAYVYMEAHKLKLGRPTSMLLVFAASAAVHEYIIALSMGFFYPVLMSTYLTIGMIVIFITRKKTGQFWNTFMWSTLFSGWGTTVCLYALEWYARANCPGSNNSPPYFFEARSWDSTCHIIQYSE